jgi:hypothetical protein
MEKKTINAKLLGNYVRIDNEMTWPSPDTRDANNDGDSLEWHFRYGTPSKELCLRAASYLAAYNQLIYSTQKHRNYICSAIRYALLRAEPK